MTVLLLSKIAPDQSALNQIAPDQSALNQIALSVPAPETHPTGLIRLLIITFDC